MAQVGGVRGAAPLARSTIDGLACYIMLVDGALDTHTIGRLQSVRHVAALALRDDLVWWPKPRTGPLSLRLQRMVEFAATLLPNWWAFIIHIPILLTLLAARSSSCFQAVRWHPAQVAQIQRQLFCLIVCCSYPIRSKVRLTIPLILLDCQVHLVLLQHRLLIRIDAAARLDLVLC